MPDTKYIPPHELRPELMEDPDGPEAHGIDPDREAAADAAQSEAMACPSCDGRGFQPEGKLTAITGRGANFYRTGQYARSVRKIATPIVYGTTCEDCAGTGVR